MTTSQQINYHVAGEGYTQGDALIGRNGLAEMGIETAWKWGDDAPEGFDGDGVSLFASEAEAREFRQWYGGTLLRVTLPADFAAGDCEANHAARDLWPYATAYPSSLPTPAVAVNEEGFRFVRGFVPAEWIEVIA